MGEGRIERARSRVPFGKIVCGRAYKEVPASAKALTELFAPVARVKVLSSAPEGKPYDNARAKRFMRTLKQEEVYLANYETYLDMIDNWPIFIEKVYNEKSEK